MNNDKNRQLWLIANKLRGSMPIEEIVKSMIYFLFLKYIEGKHKNENVFSFYDDKYSVEYLCLTYGKAISADNIKDYLINAETELGIKKGIIANGLYNLLLNFESEKIRFIFEAIKSVDINSYREYDKVAVYLLEQITLSNIKSSCEDLTNFSVAKLIEKILNCKPGMTVYDGFCGHGVLINTVAANKCAAYIQDVNISAVSIAAVLTVLSGTKIGNISCGDSLLNPMESTTKYDCVVIEPPLGLKYDSDYIRNIPSGNYFDVGLEDRNSICVRHAIAHMKDNGIAAVIVPMGLLFSSGRIGLARELYASQYVDTVIELPTGIIPNTAVAASILILKKKKRFDDIFMINTKDFTKRTEKKRSDITADGIDEIVRIYRNREIIEGVSNSVSHETLLKNEYNMCTTVYVNNPTVEYIEESVAPYRKKYYELSSEISEIDSRLTALRERFYK